MWKKQGKLYREFWWRFVTSVATL